MEFDSFCRIKNLVKFKIFSTKFQGVNQLKFQDLFGKMAAVVKGQYAESVASKCSQSEVNGQGFL